MQSHQIDVSYRVKAEASPVRGIPQDAIRFERFCVLPSSRLLLRDGHSVSIGGRAFDLLMALLRARGQLVEKSEIAKTVWPASVVDESNIRFQIAALRKILGPAGKLIRTISGRGYLFADVDQSPILHCRIPSLSTRNTSIPYWLRFDADELTERTRGSQYVALIDDDPAVLEALEGLMRSAGLNVQAFLSIRSFLSSVQSSPPACIVLDALLPHQSGLDFQEELNLSGVRLPIVFISGHADIPMSVRAIKAGAFDFLTKPIRHDDLLGAINLAMSTAIFS